MKWLPIVLALISVEAHAAPRVWDCTHSNPVAPNNLRSVVLHGTLREPTAVQVTNDWTHTVIAQTRKLLPRPNYAGGYWFTNYRLDARLIGTFSGVRYMLLTPTGVLGSQFNLQIHETFPAGTGSLQNLYACVQR